QASSETPSISDRDTTARYTDVSIFEGPPGAHLSRVTEDQALLFGRPYTVEVAIRAVPRGLSHEGERVDVSQHISRTAPSELLAVLTSLDSAPGGDPDISI